MLIFERMLQTALAVSGLFFVLLVGTQAGASSALLQGKVSKIRIVGNLRTEATAIRRMIRLRPNQPLSIPTIRGDVRRIYGMERFKDVRVEATSTAKGLVITYRVSEKPAIREIKIIGYKELSKDDITGVMNIKKFGILDRAQLQKNVEKIRDLYVEKGFYLADVQVEVTNPKQASVVVTFRIRENAKIRIRRINFVGNNKVASTTLRQYLQTSENDVFSLITGRSTYQEALIQRDLFLLNSYYYDHGFIHVKLGKPRVYLSRDRKFIHITYYIEEGESYHYGKIVFSGDLLYSQEKMFSYLSIKEGELFNRTKLYRRNILRLTTLYQDHGYAYVNVTPQHKIDRKSRRLALTFEVQKGPRVRIERIEISGNTTTQDRVIRRELRVAEGEYYNGSRVHQSQRRIFALGFFTKNDPLYGVKVVSRRGAKPDRIILKFVVKEKPTGTFQIGAGFSSVESFIFNAQISKNNLFGRGQTLSLAAQISAIRQLFQLQFLDPRFLDTFWTFAFSAFNYQRDYRTYLSIGFIETSTGGTLTWGYPIIEDLHLLFTYKLARIQISASSDTLSSGIRLKGFFSGADGPTWTSSVRGTIRWDKRNNRLFPSEGHMQSLSVEHADKLIGSDNRFTRFTAISRWYLSLPLNIVLKFNANLGWVISPSPRGVPAFERYRMGGINTIRGYRAFTIGPTRKIPANSDVAYRLEDFNWGGSKEFLFNFEVEFPIFAKVGIKGVLFFDAGNAFDDNEFFFQDKRHPHLPLGLYMSVGFGFRWFSPIGPLRFEWGIPLTPRLGDEPILFEFNIGNAF